MLIYIIEIIIFILTGVLLYDKKISKKTFLTTVSILMIVILGLRGINVGEDTAHYIDIFKKIDYISWVKLLTSGIDVVYETIWGVDRSMEIGYMALNKIIRIFTPNPQILLFTVSSLTLFLITKFVYDNCENVFFSMYIVLCESFYMQSFNLARQMLAIAIGLQAYTFLRSNCKYSILKAILIIFIAFAFHKSAIVLLVLVLLWLVKKRRKVLKYIIISSLISPFAISFIGKIISTIIPRYSAYLENNYWDANIGGIFIMWIIELIMVVYSYCYYKNKHGKEIFLMLSCVLFYISLEIIGLRITAFSRVSLYFRVFLIFLIPYFSMFFNRKSQPIYKMCMFLLLLMLFLSYASSPSRLYSFYWQL